MKEVVDTPMIEIVGLKKSYGGIEALKGLSFSVPKGQIVGFLGPNGAGKSTTMKILTGFLPYSLGSVRVGGFEVGLHPDKTKKMIGYLAENNPQYEDMMVLEYLDFVADIRKIPEPYKKDKIDSAIIRCGLRSVVHKDVGELSKGFRQRVGLAQAILHDPQLLILDEPTSGLDPNQIIEIRNLIKELGKETTVLMSTHILQEAQSTCERILIINNGLLVADDTPEELASGDFGSIIMELAAKGVQPITLDAIKAKFLNIGGVVAVKEKPSEGNHLIVEVSYENADPRRALFEAIVSADLIALEFKRHRASLEETFRRLTTQIGENS